MSNARTIIVERDSRDLTTRVVAALNSQTAVAENAVRAETAATSAAASSSEATTSAGQASASAAEALALAQFVEASLASLRAQQRAFAAGSFILTRAEGFRYEVMPTGTALGGAAGYHLTTAGGVLLRVVPGTDGYDIRAFGAVGDGVADDTVPMRLMFETTETRLNLKGRFRITQSLTRAISTTLQGQGLQSSVIRLDANATITLQGGDGADHYNLRYFRIDGISFRAVGQHNGTHMVRIEYVGGVGGAGKSVSVTKSEWTAEDAAGGFNRGLDLHNCRNLVISDLRFHGRRNYPVYGTAMRISGDETTGAPVEIFIDKVKCFFIDKAFDVAGWVEGLQFTGCIGIACHYGIFARGVGIARPLIGASDCHFNCDIAGIDIDGFVGLTIIGNHLYGSLTDNTSTATWRGIRIAGEGVALNSRIEGNDFQTFHNWTDSACVEIIGNTAEENVIISSNTCGAFVKGFILGVNTNRVVVTDDNSFIAVTTPIEDLGTDNRIAVGTYNSGGSRKRYGDGLDFRFGSSVVTLNANGDGAVTISPAFHTAQLMGVVCNGDPASSGSLAFPANFANATTSLLPFSVRPNPGAVNVRVNWIALGQ